MKLYHEVTDPSVLKMRPSIKGKTIREAQNTFRITHVDQFVEAGTYVRVHVRPKRFPRCREYINYTLYAKVCFVLVKLRSLNC
ncbi:hypothetical protein HanLR1_Chr00c0042g0698651 [Helianthus annuus]|nr:hypothetical protein HanLR1_Chr00c0042g0698651 [Helianthus annuus]